MLRGCDIVEVTSRGFHASRRLVSMEASGNDTSRSEGWQREQDSEAATRARSVIHTTTICAGVLAQVRRIQGLSSLEAKISKSHVTCERKTHRLRGALIASKEQSERRRVMVLRAEESGQVDKPELKLRSRKPLVQPASLALRHPRCGGTGR